MNRSYYICLKNTVITLIMILNDCLVIEKISEIINNMSLYKFIISYICLVLTTAPDLSRYHFSIITTMF